jgi:hypothetical protein
MQHLMRHRRVALAAFVTAVALASVSGFFGVICMTPRVAVRSNDTEAMLRLVTALLVLVLDPLGGAAEEPGRAAGFRAINRP